MTWCACCLCFRQMSLLGEVFSSELEVSDLAPSALSSYSFTYPESSRTVPNKYDSGIFTIRHVQYYRERWFSVVSSAKFCSQCNVMLLSLYSHVY